MKRDFFPPMNQRTTITNRIKTNKLIFGYRIRIREGTREGEKSNATHRMLSPPPPPPPSSSARARPLKRDGARKRRERAVVARLGNGRKGACPLADITRDISCENEITNRRETKISQIPAAYISTIIFLLLCRYMINCSFSHNRSRMDRFVIVALFLHDSSTRRNLRLHPIRTIQSSKILKKKIFFQFQKSKKFENSITS